MQGREAGRCGEDRRVDGHETGSWGAGSPRGGTVSEEERRGGCWSGCHSGGQRVPPQTPGGRSYPCWQVGTQRPGRGRGARGHGASGAPRGATSLRSPRETSVPGSSRPPPGSPENPQASPGSPTRRDSQGPSAVFSQGRRGGRDGKPSVPGSASREEPSCAAWAPGLVRPRRANTGAGSRGT